MSYYSPLFSAVVTFALIPILASGNAVKMLDIPNERSLHTEPTSRTGGVALMSGVFSGWMLLTQFWVWWIVLPALGLFILSLVDDVWGLSVNTRLLGHFSAALLLWSGAAFDWIWLLPVLLFIVWMTNLYNFMDGSDGLAGGMALLGFSFYGIAGLLSGNEAFAMLNFSIAAAALGFLFHNFPPARVFMGDSGSIPLGFLAAAFGVWGWQLSYWPFWFPLLVFSPFVADATVTLLKRTRRGKKITQAHRGHYYQRLVKMGWGHRNTAIAEYVLMLLAGASALMAIDSDVTNQVTMLVCWGLIYIVLMKWIDRCWRKLERPGEKFAGDQ